MKEPTIKDVAEKAGVSIGTVSRVINNADNVKPQNVERVLEAIEQLKFMPNQNAKNLKVNKTFMIGIIVPNLVDEFYNTLVNTIEQLVITEGYLLLVLCSHNDEELERRNINYLWEKRVDGIIIISLGRNEELLEEIRERNIPVLFADRKPQRNVFDSVYADKQGTAQAATAYLARNGHKRIALVTGAKSLGSNMERFNGYIKAMFEKQLSINNDHIWFGDFTKEFGISFMEWFSKQDADSRPTAVITGSTGISYGIMLTAKQYGINIPEDLSLVSYGNIGYYKLIEPQITYIEQMSEEISTTAAQRIIEKINDPGSYVKEIVMSPRMIIRDSVRELNMPG